MPLGAFPCIFCIILPSPWPKESRLSGFRSCFQTQEEVRDYWSDLLILHKDECATRLQTLWLRLLETEPLPRSENNLTLDGAWYCKAIILTDPAMGCTQVRPGDLSASFLSRGCAKQGGLDSGPHHSSTQLQCWEPFPLYHHFKGNEITGSSGKNQGS